MRPIDSALGGGTGRRRSAAVPSAGCRPSALASRLGRARFPLAAPSWPESVPRPPPEPELGVHYDTDWSRRYPVRLARAMVLDNVARPLARIVASPLIRGEEGLADLEGPVIFAANHASHVDTPLLLSCLPLRFRHRTVVAAAADYFFDRRWKADAWSFLLAAIPIERTKVNRRSADLAAGLLADGWNLIIFPEGGRSPDGWAQELHRRCRLPGRRAPAARWCRSTWTGPATSCPRGGKGLRRTRTTITFGTPLWPERGRGRPPLRRAHRGGRGHPGQRGRLRLVDGPQAGRAGDHSPAPGPRRRRLAPVVGAVPGPRTTADADDDGRVARSGTLNRRPTRTPGRLRRGRPASLDAENRSVPDRLARRRQPLVAERGLLGVVERRPGGRARPRSTGPSRAAGRPGRRCGPGPARGGRCRGPGRTRPPRSRRRPRCRRPGPPGPPAGPPGPRVVTAAVVLEAGERGQAAPSAGQRGVGGRPRPPAPPPPGGRCPCGWSRRAARGPSWGRSWLSGNEVPSSWNPAHTPSTTAPVPTARARVPSWRRASAARTSGPSSPPPMQ